MCLIITQIMEVEEKIANCEMEGERLVLQHELASLEQAYDKKYNGNEKQPWHGSEDLALLGQCIIDAGKH